jgi:hypothetical protein
MLPRQKLRIVDQADNNSEAIETTASDIFNELQGQLGIDMEKFKKLNFEEKIPNGYAKASLLSLSLFGAYEFIQANEEEISEGVSSTIEFLTEHWEAILFTWNMSDILELDFLDTAQLIHEVHDSCVLMGEEVATVFEGIDLHEALAGAVTTLGMSLAIGYAIKELNKLARGDKREELKCRRALLQEIMYFTGLAKRRFNTIALLPKFKELKKLGVNFETGLE